ncbi:MAG: hypothetical protein ACREL2_11965 [Gemmatimonadales bacterium]
MRYPVAAFLLLALAACTGRNPRDPAPGDPALLTGDWQIIAHSEGRPDLHISVTLAPSGPNDPTVPASLRGGTVEGHFQLADHAWLPTAPTDSGVSGFVGADSSVIVYLRLEGRCNDCGNLGFAGRFVHDSILGHWSQEMTTTSPQGAFAMRRVAPTSPTPAK